MNSLLLLTTLFLSASSTIQQANDLPMHVGGSVKPPVVIHSADPEIPPGLPHTWSAQVYLWVEEDGTPSHVRVVKSSVPGTESSAVKAVSQYRFKPATLNGTPVRVDLYIEVFVDGF